VSRKEQLNVFTCKTGRSAAVVVAYNRGHAAKLFAKRLQERGEKLTRLDPVEQLDLTQEQVVFLKDPDNEE
jgi:hypothetical protein